MEKFFPTLKPFYVIGKFLGYFPFHITKSRKIKSSIFEKVFLTLTLFLNLLNVYVYSILFNLYFKEGSTWSKISFTTVSIISAGFITITSIGNFLTKETILKALSDLKFIDEKLFKCFGVKIDYKSEKRAAKRVLMISMITFLIFMNFSYLATILNSEEIRSSNSKYGFVLIIVHVGICSYVSLFYVVIGMIRRRIEVVNEIIGKLMERRDFSKDLRVYERDVNLKYIKNNSNNEKMHSKNIFSQTFNSLSVIQLKVIDLISKINKIFSFSMIIFMFFNLVGMTFTLYEDYVVLTKWSNAKYSYAVGANFTNGFYFIKAFFIIMNCSLLKREGREMVENMQENVFKIESKNFTNKLRIFVMQLKHCEMKLSCGLCDFDWKIIYGVRKPLNIHEISNFQFF